MLFTQADVAAPVVIFLFFAGLGQPGAGIEMNGHGIVHRQFDGADVTGGVQGRASQRAVVPARDVLILPDPYWKLRSADEERMSRDAKINQQRRPAAIRQLYGKGPPMLDCEQRPVHHSPNRSSPLKGLTGGIVL